MRRNIKFLGAVSLLMIVLMMALTACSGGTATTAAATTAAAAETTAETTVATEAAEPVELLVSAAASLTDVMAELAEDYKDVNPDITITYTFGSSGALQNQIEEGAPADVFLSAGKKQMNALSEKDIPLEGTEKDLLENKIVLIVPKGNAKGITSFEDVATDLVSMVALGEPTGVPVGQYSAQIFTNLGIIDEVTAKANYGSDVRQVLTWVENGEVDCGVVYMTDAMTSELVDVVAIAPEGSTDKIIYPAAVIGTTEYPDQAKAFLDYLSTDRAAAIFEKYGFSVL
jgi:molybdate transport system substrate-binding protein